MVAWVPMFRRALLFPVSQSLCSQGPLGSCQVSSSKSVSDASTDFRFLSRFDNWIDKLYFNLGSLYSSNTLKVSLTL